MLIWGQAPYFNILLKGAWPAYRNNLLRSQSALTRETTMKWIVASAVVAFAMPAPLGAQKQETGFLDRVVTVGPHAYRYQVFVPPDHSKAKSYPVILFLHGSGERGDDGLSPTQTGIGTAIRRNRDRFPTIVVFPQANTGHRWDNEMQTRALAALDAATVEFGGDRERTYLTGLSMGGRGAWSLATRQPTRFAAMVIIAAGVTVPPDWSVSERETALRESSFLRSDDPYGTLAAMVKHLPVRIFHGSADAVAPVADARRIAETLKRLGADVKYTEYEGVPHNSWDRAFWEPDLMPWLLNQRRPATRNK